VKALCDSVDGRLALAKKIEGEFIEIPISGSVLKSRWRIPLYPKSVARSANKHVVDLVKKDRDVLSRGIISIDFPTPALLDLLLENQDQ
jgi:hypothetical protein